MPEWSATGAHPDLETLAAYVDGRLGDREHGEVERHIAECEDCYELMVEVVQTQGEDVATPATIEPAAVTPEAATTPPSMRATVLPFYGRRWFAGVTAGLAAAAAILLAVRLQPEWFGRDETDPRFEKLVAAVGTERTVEARLTGGFEYGRLRTATRSGQPAPTNYSLLAAAGELQKAADINPIAANVHAYGVAQLLLGQYDAAVQTLEAAAKESETPRTLSDLSAAYLARSAALDRAVDVPRALDVAERALHLDARQAEALYNKALALETLGVRDQAVVAWRQFLQVDDSSPWADEARSRIARLVPGPNTSRLAPRVGRARPSQLPAVRI